MSTGQNRLYGILLAAILIAGGVIAIIVTMPQDTPDSPLLPESTIIGSDGTIENVTLTEMTEMSTITRNGSYQNSYGNVRGVGTYTGVLISDLVELVGGMLEDDSVRITASDGYSQTFDYSKVYPDAAVWDVQGDMVLAYGYNDTIVPDYERGHQLIFLPEDGYYSNSDANATTDPNPRAAGPQCISNVAEIKVLSGLVVDIAGVVEGFKLREISEMVSISGEGGYKRSSGTISGPYDFTGVSVFDLLSGVATLPSNYTLTATAIDGWSSEYTKSVVEGTVNGYTPTGDPLEEIQSTMLLAYEEDGSSIADEDGPLRIVFINEDGNLTDGYRWVRQVVNLTITEVPLSGLVQEERSLGITSNSSVELQICGQSKLFTCTLVRRF
ncbi:MAG: hypothetical protein ACXAB5_02810 [Candidatus Thorarchaeota archaeon]|jgi:hypothetical protein